MLRVKYGWAGEGKYSALQNMIASSDECILDLNQKHIQGTLALDLGFTFEELTEFINYLTVDCNLLINNDGKITTADIQETYSKVKHEREKARERKNSANKSRTPPENPNSSDGNSKSSANSSRTFEESKVEESKEKESSVALSTHTLEFETLHNYIKAEKDYSKFKEFNLEHYFSRVNNYYIDNKFTLKVMKSKIWFFIDNDIKSKEHEPVRVKQHKEDSVSVAYELVKNNLEWIKSLSDKNPDEVVPELIKKCKSPATKDTLFEAYVEKAYKYYLAN